jgi:hypothetical protein
MLSLQKRAKELGANAVIHIVNNYGNNANPNATDFECHVGNHGRGRLHIRVICALRNVSSFRPQSHRLP